AYAQVSPRGTNRGDLRRIVSSNDLARWRSELKNDFKAPIAEVTPAVAEIRTALHDTDAAYVSLSGSGGAVYGIFETRDTARAARDAVQTPNVRVHLMHAPADPSYRRWGLRVASCTLSRDFSGNPVLSRTHNWGEVGGSALTSGIACFRLRETATANRALSAIQTSQCDPKRYEEGVPSEALPPERCGEERPAGPTVEATGPCECPESRQMRL
ncbi:MAG: hypothetical protein BRD53_05395, partial [Bacteroidetes bacterium SW_7_64_58]